MKKFTKGRIAMIVSLLLGMCIFFAGAVESDAASGPYKLCDGPTTLYERSTWPGSLDIEPVKNSTGYSDYEILSIKSSNKKVIKVRKWGKSEYDYELWPRAAGKSKITMKYRHKGKVYTMSKVCTVKKYPKPFKSIKINGKPINLKKNKFGYFAEKFKSSSARIKITPKKGWRIVHCDYAKAKPSKDGSYTMSYKKMKTSIVKKGSKIKLPKKYRLEVYVTLKNKIGDTLDYTVTLYR